MSLESISIRGKLEVLPGGVINIPGCEPITAFTSTTLAANMSCKSSIITLKKAKELIPEATMEYTINPLRWYFVLPSGPPPQTGCQSTSDPNNPNRGCITDWYQVLKDGAEPVATEEEDTSSGAACDPFEIGMFGGM